MNIGSLVAIVPVVLAVALIILIIRRNITGRSESISRDITAAIPAIVVLMVAALLIGSFASTVDKNTYELYDCVPLSAFGSNATIVGDCAEEVTIGGEQYVRMTDLGTFTATSGETSKEYKVTKAKMDLVLLTGQSNSYYYTNPTYYDGSITIAPGKAFYLGQETGTGRYAGLATPETLSDSGIVDMVASDGSLRVAAMYPDFCADYVSETGHKVLVINAGVGGRGIAYWDDGAECDEWMTDVTERTSSLAAEVGIILTPAVVLWSQGHGDADETVEYYAEHLIPLVEKFHDGYYSGYRFRNVLSVLPRHETEANPTNPALAQMYVASIEPGFIIASSLPVHFTESQMRDSAHYTQEAYGWLGQAFARSAAEVMGYTPVTESLVMTSDVGAVASLPSTVDVLGTSGEPFSVPVTWTATADPSEYEATFGTAPTGTVLIDGLESFAYPSISAFYTYDDNGALITGLTSEAATATRLILPDDAERIGISAFENNAVIEYAATLPDSNITIVRQKAFSGCTALAEADLPTVTTFGNYTFNGCTSLKGFEIAEGTNAIPMKMFQACSALESVTIPDTVTSIGTDAFRQCGALKSVYIPGGVATIGDNAFRLCTGITSVSFGEGYSATLGTDSFVSWTFYDTDGTTVLDKTVASNLAGHTFAGTASALVMQS